MPQVDGRCSCRWTRGRARWARASASVSAGAARRTRGVRLAARREERIYPKYSSFGQRNHIGKHGAAASSAASPTGRVLPRSHSELLSRLFSLTWIRALKQQHQQGSTVSTVRGSVRTVGE